MGAGTAVSTRTGPSIDVDAPHSGQESGRYQALTTGYRRGTLGHMSTSSSP